MRKIVDYKIIHESQVDEHIKSGWQPFGGGFVNSQDSFHTAMVKYEEELPAPVIVPEGYTIYEGQTPEQKFKVERLEYFKSTSLYDSATNRYMRRIDGAFLEEQQINDIIDQEWLDHLDQIDEIASRSM